MPQPITQAWELTIPIPWWILDFFHIERGLLITLETQISAHREDEEDNSFFYQKPQQGHRSLKQLKDRVSSLGTCGPIHIIKYQKQKLHTLPVEFP